MKCLTSRFERRTEGVSKTGRVCEGMEVKISVAVVVAGRAWGMEQGAWGTMNYERRRMKEVKVEIEAKAEEWENPSDRLSRSDGCRGGWI